MKKFNKKFALIETLIVVGVIGLAAALFLPKVNGQQYFTNSTAATGPYQYNSAFANSAQAAYTISRQQAAGILEGSFPPASATAGLITNNFPTGFYTATPAVLLTSSTTNSANIPALSSVSATNFVIALNSTNGTVYWESVGH